MNGSDRRVGSRDDAADTTRSGLSGVEVLRRVQTSTDHFDVTSSGHLTIDGCNVVDLVQQYGSPLFVISESTLRDNAVRVQEAFGRRWPRPVNVMFAIKANNNLAVRRIMSDLGLGGDCFSDGEVYATLEGGADPTRVALNGSNKSSSAISAAIQNHMLIQIDSVPDLDLVEQVAAELDEQARIAVRIRLDSETYDHTRSRTEGLPELKHFIDTEQVGSSHDVAVAILRRSLGSKLVRPEGFHFHLGRLSRHPEYLRWWSAGVADMIVRIFAAIGFRPRILNVGGGYAREREPEHVGGPLMNPATIEAYAEIVTAELRNGLGRALPSLPELWLEPGRYIAGNAGTLLSQVGVVKSDVGMKWINVDASINDLPRVENMDWDYVPLAADKMHEPATEQVDIVGSLCVGRHLKTNGRMPPLRRGDLVAFLDAGAYAETASTQYNAVPRPATVLVRREKTWLIKPRETIEEIFSRHSVPSHLEASGVQDRSAEEGS